MDPGSMGTVIALPDEEPENGFLVAEVPVDRNLRPRLSYGEDIAADRLMTGKRGLKGLDDYEEDAGLSKKPKVCTDMVDTVLAGTLFFRIQASRPNCLMSFDGTISKPLFFEEKDTVAAEVPVSSLGLEGDALSIKMHGVEVEDEGTRRSATMQEFIAFLKWFFTNGEDGGVDDALRPASGNLLPCYIAIKCDEAPAWLTFDVDTMKAKVVVSKGSKVVEVSPQQFELEAGCHARKWRNSFRVQAAYKVIRQGILTPTPFVELSAYLHRLLGLEAADPKQQPSSSTRLTREPSGGSLGSYHLNQQQQQAGQQQQQQQAALPIPIPQPTAAKGGVPGLPRAPSPAPAARLALGSSAGGGWGSTHQGTAPSAPASLPTSSTIYTAAAAAPQGVKPSHRSSNGTEGVRNLCSSFVAIPIAQAGGRVAGPLSPAEMQAIQAVVRFTDGPQLAWAVQGIMHHIFSQYRDQRAPPGLNHVSSTGGKGYGS